MLSGLVKLSHAHVQSSQLTNWIAYRFCSSASYFIILLSLMPDDFTCQGDLEHCAQWIKLRLSTSMSENVLVGYNPGVNPVTPFTDAIRTVTTNG